MAIKADFTEAEWTAIRNAPLLVAAATMLAGNSGITGTFSESFAVAQSLQAGLSSGNPLLQALSTPDEVRTGQEEVKGQLKPGEAPDVVLKRLEDLSMTELDRATSALTAKGGNDAADYKKWVYDTAVRIANASKEGTFLGFGGERISDGEEVFLNRLKATLGVG